MSESDTMFNERDRRCATVQLVLSTDPSYDNRTITSTLKMQIWIATNNKDVPGVLKTKFSATIMVFGVVSSEGHIMPPHFLEVGLKINSKVYLDVLKSVVIPWCNQVAGGRPWVCQQDPGLVSEGVLRLFTLLSLAPLPPTWTSWTTSIGHTSRTSPYVENMTSHNTKSQPDCRHPPSIRYTPASACGKDILPVPDPYRGGDYGWRRLHWIDVNSTT